MVLPISLSSNTNPYTTGRRCCSRGVTLGVAVGVKVAVGVTVGVTVGLAVCCCSCWTSSRRRGWRWRRSSASRCPVKPKHLIGSARQRDAGCFLSPGRTDTKPPLGFARLALDSLAAAIPQNHAPFGRNVMLAWISTQHVPSARTATLGKVTEKWCLPPRTADSLRVHLRAGKTGIVGMEEHIETVGRSVERKALHRRLLTGRSKSHPWEQRNHRRDRS